MHIHEFGDRSKPIMLLLPGTACHWKANFQGVIDTLAKDFFVAAVAYTGFERGDAKSFDSMLAEVARIEDYVTQHYDGHIQAAYGSSLGGSFVGLLGARHRIHMRYGILGSSDLDQAESVAAALQTGIATRIIYPLVHEGRFSFPPAQRFLESKMKSDDPYTRALATIFPANTHESSCFTRETIVNQYHSDLVTPLPDDIDNGETEFHMLYAKKMGPRYLERYRRHFAHPVIHEHDLRHEELLMNHPNEWCELMKEIALPQNTKGHHV